MASSALMGKLMLKFRPILIIQKLLHKPQASNMKTLRKNYWMPQLHFIKIVFKIKIPKLKCLNKLSEPQKWAVSHNLKKFIRLQLRLLRCPRSKHKPSASKIHYLQKREM